MRKFFIAILVLTISLQGFSQQPDNLLKKLDSLNKKTDSVGKQQNNTTPSAYNERTKITFRSYFTLLGSDIKQEFTKPFHMHRQDWHHLGAFVLAGGALGFADEPIQKGAVKLRNSSTAVSNVSKYVTKFGGLYETYTLGSLMAYGFIFKKEKLRTTTLLATQAYITGGLIESVAKYLTGRTRPSFYDPAVEAEPKFMGPLGNTSKDFTGSRSNSSFPSGHTTVAFAAATVFAMEYKSTPWVPIFSYSVASLIAISRITENKHWATDVFAGAALGFLSGRQVVNNYHRYAKIKAPRIAGYPVHFNLDYSFHQLRPGLVVRFP